ncbi:MAG: hypothetical protein MH204_03640 [Fimbriimonadaceae bacterium]|nr:hypothetical protein [Fimbriimonadaceae bacterium]
MKLLVNGREQEFPDRLDLPMEHDGPLVRFTVDGRRVEAAAVRIGETTWVSAEGVTWQVQKVRRARSAGAEPAAGALLAPLPGVVIEVACAVGDSVAKGARLVVMEAMKMQQTLTAPFDGVVARVEAKPGHQKAEGDLLVEVTPAGGE